MSATFVDAGEMVSRSCPAPRRHLLTRPPRACQDRLFSHRGYDEGLNDPRTKLAAFFSHLLGRNFLL